MKEAPYEGNFDGMTLLYAAWDGQRCMKESASQFEGQLFRWATRFYPQKCLKSTGMKGGEGAGKEPVGYFCYVVYRVIA